MNEEPKRDRSPNYPKMPLEQAMELVSRLHKKAGKAQVQPSVAVNALGYSSLNGAALTTLGAITQYGLLDRPRGEGVSVSGLALRLLHPVNDDQSLAARRESSLIPKVFNELFTGGFQHSDEDLICNHLIQNGFTPDGAKKAASVFKSNVDFAKLRDDNIQRSLDAESNAEQNDDNKRQVQQPISQKPLPPINTMPPMPSSDSLSLPLESGKYVSIPIGLTEDDFELLLGTLQLWKKKIVKAPASQPLKNEISEDQRRAGPPSSAFAMG